MSEEGMVRSIEGYFISGGEVLAGENLSKEFGINEGATFLTKQFFMESRLEIPLDAKEVQLGAYRYYQPSVNQLMWGNVNRARRGGGRDHLVFLEGENVHKRALSYKGSGTNEFYSRSNDQFFDIENFRSNGLQSLDEVLLEWITAKNFERQGIPMIPHDQIVLLPKELQSRKFAGRDFRKLAAQTVRRHLVPRESYYGKEFADNLQESHYRFMGALYFENIGHGALNPENIGAGGYMLDFGHVTHGNPLLSGAYRCNLCVGINGSSRDETMVGLLDHYFGRNAGIVMGEGKHLILSLLSMGKNSIN